MATADYEYVIENAGFKRAPPGEALATKVRPYGPRSRTAVAQGTREEAGATIDVQLQDVWVYNRRGLAGVARIRHPGIKGSGFLRAKPVYGAIQSIFSGPKVVVAILMAFMIAGVGVIMIPGFLLILLITRLMQRGDPVVERPELASPMLGWRYSVWGADLEAARSAVPVKLQEAVILSNWFGWVEVKDGEILLESPIGWTRYDLWGQLLAMAVTVSRLS